MLPPAARRLIDSESLVVSPMAVLELDLLRLADRITAPGAAVVSNLADSIGLSVSETSFPAIVRAAAGLTWTRNPFDRLICAQALADAQRPI